MKSSRGGRPKHVQTVPSRQRVPSGVTDLSPGARKGLPCSDQSVAAMCGGKEEPTLRVAGICVLQALLRGCCRPQLLRARQARQQASQAGGHGCLLLLEGDLRRVIYRCGSRQGAQALPKAGGLAAAVPSLPCSALAAPPQHQHVHDMWVK